MDARQRWELRKEAMAAVAGLPEPHKSECFNDFVKEEELDHATHQALWRELFLRQQSFAQKPAPHEPCCFCDKCVGPSEEADDETHNTAKKRLGLLVVYPDYDWVPPSPPKKDERPDPEAQQQQQKQKQQKQLEQLERAAHHYLQRLGRLPKPLPTVQWDGHRRLLPEEVRQHTRVLADSSITPDSLLEVVMSEAGRCEVLWILMCGHGAAEGLVLADGSRAALSRVAAALSKASFAGTVVVSLNTCQAELSGPQPYCGCSCSSMPASASTRLEPAGWHSELPFRWVVLHSCGYEPQKPSHAHHFARLLGRLAAERPAYTELRERVEQLWVETRAEGARPEQYRRPPNFSMGGKYGGRFLGPATLLPIAEALAAAEASLQAYGLGAR